MNKITAQNPKGSEFRFFLVNEKSPLTLLDARLVLCDHEKKKPFAVGIWSDRENQFFPKRLPKNAKERKKIDPEIKKAVAVAQWSINIIINKQSPPQGYTIEAS